MNDIRVRLIRRRVILPPIQCMKSADFLGHVNNVTYNKYAESARINWAQRYATDLDLKHADQWRELWTSKGNGLILRSIRTDFKFVKTLFSAQAFYFGGWQLDYNEFYSRSSFLTALEFHSR